MADKGVKGFRLDVINLISKPDIYEMTKMEMADVFIQTVLRFINSSKK
ncbi:hypothetical protein KEH51_19435 [[Brevibacterium] frigoritolerans]|uniref:Glycosyl hydrolase family 13 catalytic domain-containing protein n=1 Tax=Peribacillus frigoritolerans TaxID=450367 RepID=A0A941FPX9_9BACI|nr:hypothetical protein [Peribacillus frigoritolerans]